MFHTVRHWWSGGRGKVTLRLFLFELFVVILGVLIAQSVANWVEARAERAEGEVLRESGQKAVMGLGQVLNYWALHAPCLRARVDSIARVAASEGQLSARQIGRPALPIVPQFSLSEADWHKLEAVAPG